MKAKNKRNCSHIHCPPQGPCKRPPKPKKQRSFIRRVSKGRAKLNLKYAKMRNREAQKEQNQVCAVVFLEKTPEVVKAFHLCGYFATDHHHDGGKVGKNLLNKGVWLCRNCHRVAEDNPTLAKKLGLSKSRHETNYKRSKV